MHRDVGFDNGWRTDITEVVLVALLIVLLVVFVAVTGFGSRAVGTFGQTE